MTTIACDRDEMASDSQATCGTQTFDVTKIHRVGEWVIGYAGSLSHAVQLLEFLRACQKVNEPPLSALRAYASLKEEDRVIDTPEVELILLAKSGIYMYEGHGHPFRIMRRGYISIGTGFQGAEALMSVGWTPTEAVKQMRLLDVYTGGKVNTLKLLRTPRKRK